MPRFKNSKQSEGHSALEDSPVSHNTRQAMAKRQPKVLPKDIPEERTCGVPADSGYDLQNSRAQEAEAAENLPCLQPKQGETPQSRRLPDAPPATLTSPLGQGIARNLFADSDIEGSAEPFQLRERAGVDFSRRRATKTWDLDAGLEFASGLNALGVEIGIADYSEVDELLPPRSEAMAAESSSEADMRAIVPVETMTREVQQEGKSGGVLKSTKSSKYRIRVVSALFRKLKKLTFNLTLSALCMKS
ncbi:hypothetical protein R1sor_009272 [Riccia sorocarpa]|uniref:Uncharacterized protein n=1 Tax=Riccia sorocarpa TaxID=122646 RepID=A0ABD3HWK7_9MARC